MPDPVELPAVEALTPGDHACLVHDSDEEHRSAVTSFILGGLERNERVIYIAHRHPVPTVTGYLDQAGADPHSLLDSSRLTILPASDICLDDGRFSKDRMLTRLRESLDPPDDSTVAGVRISAEASWLAGRSEDREAFYRFESELGRLLDRHECSALCQYDRRLFDPSDVLRSLDTHPTVIVDGRVHANPHFRRPDDLRETDPLEVQLDQTLKRLVDRNETEERFRQIADHIDDVFWITTPGKDVMEYVSPAYRDVMGYPPAELYEDARRWLEHVHPDDRERVRGALPRQVEGTYEEEYRIVRSDGEVRWIWDRAFPIEDEQGEVHRIVGVAEDVTERRSLERQLRRSQKMEAVGRLAGGIAHDFNNLLTVIRSQSDLLLQDLVGSGPLVEEMEIIRDSADRAARLTRQLLAFSRKQVLQPRAVDLNEILGGMYELLARTLGEDVTIEMDLDAEVPPIRVDPGQLEQVVMNLAVNARDAMPEGGGTLRLSTVVEEVETEKAASTSELEPGTYGKLKVSDNGIGMDEETREQIFEPFFTTKEREHGTGLGLSTSYGIVEQSGGHIQVESEPGVGSIFTVWLPSADGEVESERSLSDRRSASADLSGNILVVEDDASVQRVVRKILERTGLNARVVDDAETALRTLEAETPFDLVLVDLGLPEMSGRELVDRIRASFPDLPLVAMSGYAEGSPGSGEELPAGVGFIQKPFESDGLLELVRENLPTG